MRLNKKYVVMRVWWEITSLLSRQWYWETTFIRRFDKSNDFDFSTNITNKLFIVKYVFVDIDVDIDITIDENDAFSRNFDTRSDKRENFDDMSFDIIVAQNICFFDVANDVANKQNSIKLNISNIANEINVFDEIKRVWIFASSFANKINSLKNEINIDFASFFAKNVANRFWWWFCTYWWNLILLENLIKQRLQACFLIVKNFSQYSWNHSYSNAKRECTSYESSLFA